MQRLYLCVSIVFSFDWVVIGIAIHTNICVNEAEIRETVIVCQTFAFVFVFPEVDSNTCRCYFVIKTSTKFCCVGLAL